MQLHISKVVSRTLLKGVPWPTSTTILAVTAAAQSSTSAPRSFKKEAADDLAAVGSAREGQGRRIRSEEEEEKKGDRSGSTCSIRVEYRRLTALQANPVKEREENRIPGPRGPLGPRPSFLVTLHVHVCPEHVLSFRGS